MEVPFQENVVRENIKTCSSSFSNVKHSHEKSLLLVLYKLQYYIFRFFRQNACNFLLDDEMIKQLIYS
jgi:hypothetical protein